MARSVPGHAAEVARTAVGSGGLVGVVTSTTGTEIVVTSDRRGVRLLLRDGGRAYSGAFGLVDSGDAFVVGDTIAATGEWIDASTLDAVDIGSLLPTMTLDVVAVENGVPVDGATERSMVEGVLPDYVGSQVDLSVFSPGDRITAVTWTHPQSDEIFILRAAHV